MEKEGQIKKRKITKLEKLNNENGVPLIKQNCYERHGLNYCKSCNKYDICKETIDALVRQY